ncbi:MULTISPECIES: integration host factor subunit beta [Legionella]|nr:MULTISPECIES: integration host factor subunit beta [Legionella]MCC5014338.1 integration host factor subunit beta [Legionella sp. 31fI33]
MCLGTDTLTTRLTEVGMIKSQLIANLAAKMTHLPEKQVTDGINRILELMSEALVDGKRIEIRGFGSFSLHYRPPRNAHNPKTGEKVVTEAKYSPHFKPGKELRERVDASRGHIPLKDTDD